MLGTRALNIARSTAVVLLLGAISACAARPAGNVGSSSPDMEPSTAPGSPPDADPSATGVIVVRGVFDPAGEHLLRLDPVELHDYSSPPIPDQPSGRFEVRVELASGELVVVPFDALVSDDSGVTQHGFFEVVAPIEGEVRAVEIIDAAGGTTFARVAGSEIVRAPGG
jgi:hypothetical protein